MTKLALNGGPPIREDSWPQWPQWGQAEQIQLMQVLESGEWGGFNEKVSEFEGAFAKLHQADYCIAAANGTLTLEASLRAFDIGPNDEVIVPPYTFIATANAPRFVGATPVFVDVEPDTYNLDVAAVAAAITPQTKAIVAVHFAGHPVDLDTLIPLAEEHGIRVIEDSAHAHGSTWRGQPVGTFGHVGSFSLQATKNMTAGEGGILITNDGDIANRLWSYVNQGRSQDGLWYEHPLLGSNLRITGWQAAILLAQLERFDMQMQTRMRNARHLHSILSEVDGLDSMRWDDRCERHAHHLFMMRYNPERFNNVSRERFIEALTAEGVPCSSGYAYPLYHQPPLNEDYSHIADCPVAEQACKEVIWLTQNMLLADQRSLQDIADAIFKIRENIDAL